MAEGVLDIARGSDLPRRTELKRQMIINACIAEFRDYGFSAARIDRIAERAGVSKRTLYKHFASKEAMFDVIVDLSLAPAPPESRVELDPNRPLSVQLADVLRDYMAIISGHEYMTVSRIIVSEFIGTGRSRSQAVQESAAVGPIEDLISQAMRAGRLRSANSQHAATQLSAMAKAFFFWPTFLSGAAQPAPAEGDLIIADCTAMFLCYYATTADDRDIVSFNINRD